MVAHRIGGADWCVCESDGGSERPFDVGVSLDCIFRLAALICTPVLHTGAVAAQQG